MAEKKKVVNFVFSTKKVKMLSETQLIVLLACIAISWFVLYLNWAYQITRK